MDRWDDIVAGMDALARQTVPPLETILVVDHNDTLLARARDEFPDVRVLDNTRTGGASGARNTGIAQAKGSIIAFVDDDACPEPDWLEELLAAYDDPSVMAVGGVATPVWPSRRPDHLPPELDWIVGCTYLGQPTVRSDVRNLWGCNMSVRAEVFERIGGFDEEVGRIGLIPLGNEETELCIRIAQRTPGARVVHQPSAVVHHRVTEARCQWSYLVSRSHAEGISKAAMSRVVGTSSRHLRRAQVRHHGPPEGGPARARAPQLPRGFRDRDLPRGDHVVVPARSARPRLGDRGAGVELAGAVRPVRVLMLAQFYPPMIGGEERHVRNLSVELASRGHEVHVACLDVGQPPVVDPGVTVHPLPNVGVKVPALYPTADRPLALPVPDPYVSRGLSRLVASVRPDVVHAHNWMINSYLPLSAARRLPLVYSLHDYSHVCPTKRLMFEDAPCSGPGLRKCFTCTTDWYGAGRGPVIQSMVRSGRPIRNRVVDVFTPVSTFVGEASQLPEQGVRWQVVPNFVPDSLLSLTSVPRDPELPSGDYFFFAGDLSDQKGVGTLLSAYARLDVGHPPRAAHGRTLGAGPLVDAHGRPGGGEVGPRPGRVGLRPRPRRGAALEVARPLPDHGPGGDGAGRTAGDHAHGRHRGHGHPRGVGPRRTAR